MTNLPDRPLKADPSMLETEQRLRQGNYMRGESRQLARLVEDDFALCSTLGLDLEFICSELDRLYQKAAEGLGDPVVVDGKYEVTLREDRGKTACPWGDRFFAPKATVVARNTRTGKVIVYSALGLHMMKIHGFFQGEGSPFRINPLDLKTFFEL